MGRAREHLARWLNRRGSTRAAFAAGLAFAVTASVAGSAGAGASPDLVDPPPTAAAVDRPDPRAEEARELARQMTSALAVAEVAADEATFALSTAPPDAPPELLATLDDAANRLGSLTSFAKSRTNPPLPDFTMTPDLIEDATAGVFSAAAEVRTAVGDPTASTAALTWTRSAGLEELEALAADAVAAAELLTDPWADLDDRAAEEGDLCVIPFAPVHLLRCDAVDALVELNAAYRAEHGRDLIVVSSFRTTEQQAVLRATLGSLAAPPGHSNHERGVAVDFGGAGGLGDFTTPLYRWLSANAPSFGWVHPAQLGPGGSGPQEPWHWEYAG